MDVSACAQKIRLEIDAEPRRDTPHLRALRKRWTMALQDEPAHDLIALAEALEHGAPQQEKWVAYELIRFHSGAFAAAGEAHVEDFAARIASWYATDAFGTVLSGPLWARGRLPDRLFDGWSRSENRWLRRSALVATVGRNAVKPDPPATFELCLRLAPDRDEMVEKAVSWALRFLSQRDRPAVVAFMDAQGRRFGARVRREVRHKLDTGVKSRRR
jgi:hypothetical protein